VEVFEAAALEAVRRKRHECWMKENSEAMESCDAPELAGNGFATIDSAGTGSLGTIDDRTASEKRLGQQKP
jgi:hypothetical protein